MPKKLLLTVALCSGFLFAKAQDVIVLLNNNTISGKVVEVGLTEIKYKKRDNPDGPVYSIAKTDVFMITYVNGSKDLITDPNAPSPKPTIPIHNKVATNKNRTIGSAYVALSQPLGNFAETSGGAAGVGWGLGAMGFAPLDSGNGYFNFQASFTIQPYQAVPIGSVPSGLDLSGNYDIWNVLAGFSVRGKPADALLYGNLLVGLNYVSVSGILSTAGYDDAAAFAIAAGAGAVYHKFHVGIRYSYSNPTFKNSRSSSYNAEQKMEMIQVLAGTEF